MKKIILFLLLISLVLSFVACDSTSEEELSKAGDSSVAESSALESVSQEESSNSNQDIESSEVISTEPESESESNSSGIIEKTISDIIVNVEGGETLKSNGYDFKSEFNMFVSVTVKGESSVVSNLESADISASIDVSGISETGDLQLVIEYTAPEGVEIIAQSENFANISIKKVSAEIVPPSETDVRIVNGVLISGTRAMERFGGSAGGGANTADMLNDFKETMGDVNVYVLPAPLASAFYAPVGYEGSISAHKNCFYGVRDNLVNVGFVDTLNALGAHADEELYFRTDHHWQALAAYYACEEFAKVAGVSFDDISTFSIKSEDGVLGSFYTSYTQDAVLGANPDTMVWYEPTREHTVEYYSREGHSGNPITGNTLFSGNNGYTKFVYGDSYTTHIKTNVGNGRKLLVFKDSYGNALAPFLVGSFDEIIVADYRYFKADVSDFIAEQGITDVMFSLAAFKVNNCSAVEIIY